MKSKFKLSTGQMGGLRLQEQRRGSQGPASRRAVRSQIQGLQCPARKPASGLGGLWPECSPRAHPLRLALRTPPDEPSPLKTPPPQPLLLLGAFCKCHDTVTPPHRQRPSTRLLSGPGGCAQQTGAEGTALVEVTRFRCRNSGPRGLRRRLAGSPIVKAVLWGKAAGRARARRSRPERHKVAQGFPHLANI